MAWTARDQKQLDALTERKRAEETTQRAAVERVVQRFYFREMMEGELVDELIKAADILIPALKQFAGK